MRVPKGAIFPENPLLGWLPVLSLTVLSLAVLCLAGWAAPAAAVEPPLVVAIDSAPATLDPFMAGDAYGVRISHQLLHETITRLDAGLNTVPGLAEWRRVGPTQYVLTVRDDVRFHDGTPLRAAHVVATLHRFMAPETGSPHGGVLRDHIATLRETGPRTLELTLKGPYPALPEALMLPVVGPGAEGEARINGTGPYRLHKRAPTELVLVANPAHRTPPGIGTVMFKVIKDDNTRLLRFRKGDIHLGINVLPLEKLVQFTRPPLKRTYTLHEAPGLSFQYLGYNLQDPALAKREVRLAIAHAINVEALITHRQRGHSVRATGLMPTGSPFADDTLSPWPHDPARAEALLEQAGYPRKEGVRLKLVYKTTTNRAARAQASIIAADLAKVGIEVEVRSYEWATFYADIIKGNFQIYSLRWIGVANPDFLHELLHSAKFPPEGRNRGRYVDPGMDALLEAAIAEGGGAQRQALYQKVHARVHTELPFLSLWHNNNVAVLARGLKGFALHPSGGFEYLHRLQWAP